MSRAIASVSVRVDVATLLKRMNRNQIAAFMEGIGRIMATTTCGAVHIQPEKWKRVTGSDGLVRAVCPTCGKFMGYVK